MSGQGERVAEGEYDERVRALRWLARGRKLSSRANEPFFERDNQPTLLKVFGMPDDERVPFAPNTIYRVLSAMPRTKQSMAIAAALGYVPQIEGDTLMARRRAFAESMGTSERTVQRWEDKGAEDLIRHLDLRAEERRARRASDVLSPEDRIKQLEADYERLARELYHARLAVDAHVRAIEFDRLAMEVEDRLKLIREGDE